MTRIETIHRAIGHVYEAALAPGGWSRAGMSIAEASASHKVIFLGEQATGAAAEIFTGFDAEAVRRMQGAFQTRPPPWVDAIPSGTPLRQTSFVSDRNFRRSAFYNEAVRPTGGFYGMIAPLAPDRRLYLVVGRDLGAIDFGADDVDATRLILPHLRTALQVQHRLAAADLRWKGAYEVMSRLTFGVVLLDTAARPIFANPCAEALAARSDGLLLKRDELSAAAPAEARALRGAIAAAIAFHRCGRDASERIADSQPPMCCQVSRRPPGRPLVLHVVPVAPADVPDGIGAATRVMVFVMEPDRPVEIDRAVLAAAFHLTHREAALALWLAGGMDLAESASRMGIGLGTARAYLKQILVKTDTHRQAEMVSLLLRSRLPIAMPRDKR